MIKNYNSMPWPEQLRKRVRGLLFTETGLSVGLGHMSRCMSLYNAFQEFDLIPQLIIKNAELDISNHVSDYSTIICDWLSDLNHLKSLLSSDHQIIVVDSYNISNEAYRIIYDSNSFPIFISDDPNIDYKRGLVVNSAIGAEELNYKKHKGIKYLLGPAHTMLKKEFWHLKPISIRPAIEVLLVTMGGTDQEVFINELVNRIKNNFHDLKIIVINGGDVETTDNLIIENSITTSKMISYMQSSDLAICAGGQTLLELMSLGIPSIVVSVADNQEFQVSKLVDRNAILYSGTKEQSDIINKIMCNLNLATSYQERYKLHNNTRRLINPSGGLKVVRELINICCN